MFSTNGIFYLLSTKRRKRSFVLIIRYPMLELELDPTHAA